MRHDEKKRVINGSAVGEEEKTRLKHRFCSQQHSFKITQCKVTNKSGLLPAGFHIKQQNQSLLLVSMSQLHWASCTLLVKWTFIFAP